MYILRNKEFYFCRKYVYSNIRNFPKTRQFSTMFDTIKNSYKTMEIRKVSILEKITKFDLEIKNGLTPTEIYNQFPLAYNTHIIHKRVMESLIRHLRDVYMIKPTVLKAQNPDLLPFDPTDSPDMVISAGGDGTFLEAASLIPPEQLRPRPLWLVGLNTDPERSLGTLCISYFDRKTFYPFSCNIQDDKTFDSPVYDNNCRYNYTRHASKKIRFKDFTLEEKWLNVSPHEIAAISRASFDPHEDSTVGSEARQLPKPSEYDKDIDFDTYSMTYDEYVRTILDKLLVHRSLDPIYRQRIRLKLFKRNSNFGTSASLRANHTSIENALFSEASSNFSYDDLKTGHSVTNPSFPHGIVNDVMIADKFFGKTFYALIQIDDLPIKRVKSSGVLITTGTGSTAWAYNICKTNFTRGSSIIQCLLDHPSIPKDFASKIDNNVVNEVVNCYNEKLKMDPSKDLLRCIIREEISDKATEDASMYTGKQVKVLALAKDAVVCIDGSKTIGLDYGDVVVFKTFETDIIWSCI
ncbi:conserved hypothetical protein [Theileria equi strain WA]|uniref:NAD(+) kinase n=1 Tax=Theileria equi strain WA TaxID=1537102 RepID=L1LGD9_THEEQ|nr:conserved hypothetical protein [Theileria equi strain WA]EKX74334.1 conserved hypothetical protein [Theileria equi strain WA]|eukprot:XP_004833786.1 conserved hypothetical protein [Theileria equi strain WA]